MKRNELRETTLLLRLVGAFTLTVIGFILTAITLFALLKLADEEGRIAAWFLSQRQMRKPPVDINWIDSTREGD